MKLKSAHDACSTTWGEELLLDLDGGDHDRLNRTVVAIRSGRRNCLNDLLGILSGDLTEDGVAVVQVRGRSNRDEELGTVGAGARIRHSQQEGAVKLELRVELVSELVAGAATAGTRGVAALNHETIDDTVEGGAIVEGARVGAVSVFDILLGALRQANKVSDGLGCVIAEKFDLDVTNIGVHDRCCSLQSHERHATNAKQVMVVMFAHGLRTIPPGPPVFLQVFRSTGTLVCMNSDLLKLGMKAVKTYKKSSKDTYKDLKKRYGDVFEQALDSAREQAEQAMNSDLMKNAANAASNVSDKASEKAQELSNKAAEFGAGIGELAQVRTEEAKKLSRREAKKARKAAAKAKKQATKNVKKRGCCSKRKAKKLQKRAEKALKAQGKDKGGFGKVLSWLILLAGVGAAVYYFFFREDISIEKEPPTVDDLKKKASDVADKAADKAEEVKEAAAEKAEELKDKASDAADAAKDKAEEVKDAAKDAADKAGAKAEQAKNQAQNKAQQPKKNTK